MNQMFWSLPKDKDWWHLRQPPWIVQLSNFILFNVLKNLFYVKLVIKNIKTGTDCANVFLLIVSQRCFFTEFWSVSTKNIGNSAADFEREKNGYEKQTHSRAVNVTRQVQ